MPSLNRVTKQFAKYLVVGGVSNSLAYGLYIAITWVGATPMIGMSIVYVVASIIAFTANRGWTFQSNASVRRSALKYLVSQILGYGTNFVLLSWLHYMVGMPHQYAQLIGMGTVAVQLFLLNRYYVFS